MLKQISTTQIKTNPPHNIFFKNDIKKNIFTLNNSLVSHIDHILIVAI